MFTHVMMILLLFSILLSRLAFGFSTTPWLLSSPRGGRRRRRTPTATTTILDASSSVQTINGEQTSGSGDDHLYSSESSSDGPQYSSQTVTPYEILHPTMFSSSSKTTANNNGSDIRIPLHSCLRLFQKTLTRIISSDSSTRQVLLSSSRDDRNDNSVQQILRIEHQVSHPVDPLCWLHAQTARRVRGRCDKTKQQQLPTLYFANAEQTLEAAVYGSAYTHNGPTDVDDFWSLVTNLPPSSNVYGGQRFDTETQPSHEWQQFGTGLWILPAVELRQTFASTTDNDHANSSSSSDNNDYASSRHCRRVGGGTNTTIAIHLHFNNSNDDGQSLVRVAQHTLQLLSELSDVVSDMVPPTTLPPIISRESSYGPNLDGQEIYEAGVVAALEEFDQPGNKEKLQKVVLARRMDLKFDISAQFHGLDMLRKWKFGGHEGGHLFYLNPGVVTSSSSSSHEPEFQREFVGCTPERLFQIRNGEVTSEALAGTRPRGSTQEADAQLSRDLFQSPKDREENLITGHLIRNSFLELQKRGWVKSKIPLSGNVGELFVRRLRHLQHICQRFRGTLRDDCSPVEVAQYLLESMHPTPAVGGYPGEESLRFIRNRESFAFDRGFYSGPFGCFGRDSADIVVAIRSSLVTRATSSFRYHSPTSLSLYAGAGIVPGSTVQGEWAETSYKLGVVSSLFPNAPLTLQSASTPNVAWANAFIEELIRCGVTQFYVCPGSRSTPLVAALAKALRANIGVLHALSVHDERGAGFRALGYGRAAGRPAAVITSSGTAISNLYPAIIEAGVDGVPMMVLTADRPYESRATGANQAVDQVKAFSSSYIRWFRDIPPPTDDVPVSVALSDACHAVDLSRSLRGPVHLNIQFRENLAPISGSIRNDDRVDSMTTFNGLRFTDVPGYNRWAAGGGRSMESFSVNNDGFSNRDTIEEIAHLIRSSRRGLIVVGNLRASTDHVATEEELQLSEVISDFAQTVGFPIIAGVQSGSLRFRSTAVIPYAEHLLKNPTISKKMQPDFVLQIGSPLVSTTVTDMITSSMKDRDCSADPQVGPLQHVLLHPHYPEERSDPCFTVSHRVTSEITPFLKALVSRLEELCDGSSRCSSELAPIVLLGRALSEKMPEIIQDASKAVIEKITSREQREIQTQLTEPQVALAMAKVMSESNSQLSLFLSSSMPVRDAEFFLYPTTSITSSSSHHGGLYTVGANRGASGIDGIISSASGFADASDKFRTTLLIGDLAALHDVNALHTISSSKHSHTTGGKQTPPLTTLVVNNNGGGIFSFLPVAKFGNDVNFEEFFGTPTNAFSFGKGAEAFGLEFHQATNYEAFVDAYESTMLSDVPTIVEAVVCGREANVAVHQEITRQAVDFITNVLENSESESVAKANSISLKRYYPAREKKRADSSLTESEEATKTLLLLHGWMGDKTDWDVIGGRLARSLPPAWSVLSMDLPGHGGSQQKLSSDIRAIRFALRLASSESEHGNSFGIDDIAASVLHSLTNDHGVATLDGVVGYSLGGRVALAMKRLCDRTSSSVVTEATKLVLISSYPGTLPSATRQTNEASTPDARREILDSNLASDITRTYSRSLLTKRSPSETSLIWSDFLHKWYSAPLWGDLQARNPEIYKEMVAKRSYSLASRGLYLADVLRNSSPGRQLTSDWRHASPGSTLYIAGELDRKYAKIGRKWSALTDSADYVELLNIGHAIIVEAPLDVAALVAGFVQPKLVEVGIETKRRQQQVPSTDEASADPTVASGQILTSNDRSTEGRRNAKIGGIEYESFTISLRDEQRKETGIVGVGWGDKARANESSRMTERSGLILNIVSSDGSTVGVGEVSPLPGLHPESLEEAETQVIEISTQWQKVDSSLFPDIDADEVLSLDGGLGHAVDHVLEMSGIRDVAASVRSGLEMALVSFASQSVGTPLLQALMENSPARNFVSDNNNLLLPLCGLSMRGRATIIPVSNPDDDIVYPSLKVKVGHQTAKEDAVAMSNALRETGRGGKIRADANRAWDDGEGSAIQFASALEGIDVDVIDRLEFIEEPLRKVPGDWNLERQVEALERWHKHSGIPYALDESIADMVDLAADEFDDMRASIRSAFSEGAGGCAAFVLKPALLGLELSMRLARLAHNELGIGAVFSSSFDSGVGLAYTAFLAAAADEASLAADKTRFSHGIGTFSMLAGDTLSPPFSSYVTKRGRLKVASLSRSFVGLGLDDMRDSFASDGPEPEIVGIDTRASTPETPAFRASAATSSSGREISVVVSLHLPFSDDVACSRFSDLPQQSRWSPWISSVAYVDAGRETEWTLNVRGVRFSWRAVSAVLEKPYLGITWESVSGLKNMGVVEFIPAGADECTMKVRMTIITPRIVSTLFPGASVFAEDFLQNKLLKWSLEMFRDVVKGDLALERGDVELGDALFGAVEGRANAIEATLSSPLSTVKRNSDDLESYEL